MIRSCWAELGFLNETASNETVSLSELCGNVRSGGMMPDMMMNVRVRSVWATSTRAIERWLASFLQESSL